MSAPYDTYNYKKYWKFRKYEHKAESWVIKGFLKKVPLGGNVLEIGAGFGRLIPLYVDRGEKIFVSDPSRRHLKTAQEKFNKKNIIFIRSTLSKLTNKIPSNSIDLVILVRVLHHIEHTEEAFKIAQKFLKKGGFFILEFANKNHFKANVSEALKGNITYSIDLEAKKIGRETKKNLLPFYNYHPDKIIHLLKQNGFTVLEKRSVSNIRSNTLKKLLPAWALMTIEIPLQRLLSKFDFGPSIFILAKKN